jgi:glycine/D-amino acid oxidase-like deaminating enzyme
LKAVVVGAGIMGLSAAWALARLGHDVTVLDQDAVPNPRGASFDQHRLIRYPYGAERGYTRMVQEAFAAWDQLWADLGERHYVATGTLASCVGDTRWVEASAAAQQALDLEVEWLAPEELATRFPLLTAGDVSAAFYSDTGGVLLADRILGALARHLAARGVSMVAHARAREIDPTRPAIVLADGRRLEPDVLVVAAGAWARRLVPDLATRAVPSRQVLVYLDPPPERAAAWATHALILDIGEGAGFYLVPPVAGTALKVGDHRFTLAGDPDDPRDPSMQEAAAVFATCRGRLADFDRYRLAGARVCYYAVEPEERFVLEPFGRSWVMAACSGHAFKFGPVLGQRLVEAIVGRLDPGDLSRWAAGRAPETV